MNIISTIPLEGWAIITLGILLVICFMLLISAHIKMNKFKSAFISIQTFMSGRDLDTLLQEYIKKTSLQEKELREHQLKLEKIENKLKKVICSADIMRFNAFDNMGSDLSFVLALLDQEGNGAVLTSILNREESRVYGKPVQAGESSYQLSEEEQKVIHQALVKSNILNQ